MPTGIALFAVARPYSGNNSKPYFSWLPPVHVQAATEVISCTVIATPLLASEDSGTNRSRTTVEICIGHDLADLGIPMIRSVHYRNKYSAWVTWVSVAACIALQLFCIAASRPKQKHICT